MSLLKKTLEFLYRQQIFYCLLVLFIGAALLTFPPKASAGFGLRNVWYPDGEIRWYAETAPGLLPHLTRAQVNNVIAPTMRYMSERLPLNIQRRYALDSSNLIFKKSIFEGSGAWTFDYWNPDAEPKDIAYFGSVNPRTTAHEFGHALGMPHEHQREDARESGQVTITTQDPNCRDRLATPTGSLDFPNYGIVDDDTFLINSIRYHSPFDKSSAMMYRNSCVNIAGGVRAPLPNYKRTRALYSPDDINSIYRVYSRGLGKNKPDELFGHATAVFDLDDDSLEDIVVAAYQKDNIVDSKINLYFYRGVATDPSERNSGRRYMPWFVHNIDTASFTDLEDSLFNSLTLASGDFDNDGRVELAVSYPYYGLDRERRVTIYGQALPTAFSQGSGSEPWGIKGLRELQTITPSDIDPEYLGKETFGIELTTGKLTSRANDDLLIGWSSARKKQFSSMSQQASGAVVHLRGLTANPNSDTTTPPLDVTTSIIIENPASQSFPIPFPSGSSRHDFGSSISLVQGSLSGAFDTLVVGAPGYDSNRGRVYIYGNSVLGSIPRIPEILATLEGEPNSRFGHSLASIYVDNTNAPNTNHSTVVGAPNERNTESRAIGAVYHYGLGFGTEVTIVERGRFTAPSHRLSSNMQWGYSLSVLGDGNDSNYEQIQVGIGAPGAESNQGLVFAWHPFTDSGDFSNSGASLTAPRNNSRRYGEVISSISFDTRHGFLISAPRGIVNAQESGFVQARINQESLTNSTWNSDRQLIHQGVKGDLLPENL